MNRRATQRVAKSFSNPQRASPTPKELLETDSSRVSQAYVCATHIVSRQELLGFSRPRHGIPWQLGAKSCTFYDGKMTSKYRKRSTGPIKTEPPASVPFVTYVTRVHLGRRTMTAATSPEVFIFIWLFFHCRHSRFNLFDLRPRSCATTHICNHGLIHHKAAAVWPPVVPIAYLGMGFGVACVSCECVCVGVGCELSKSFSTPDWRVAGETPQRCPSMDLYLHTYVFATLLISSYFSIADRAGSDVLSFSFSVQIPPSRRQQEKWLVPGVAKHAMQWTRNRKWELFQPDCRCRIVVTRGAPLCLGKERGSVCLPLQTYPHVGSLASLKLYKLMERATKSGNHFTFFHQKSFWKLFNTITISIVATQL